MDVASPQKTCLICAAPNSAVHFGIDACKACASFFKRARLSGRCNPCRQGTRSCAVVRANGSMCRGCRFEKCIAIGMAYDGPMRKTNSQIDAGPNPTTAQYCGPVRDSLLDRIAREHAPSLERHRARELALVQRCNLERLPHPTEEVYLATFQFAMAAINENLSETWEYLLSVFPSLRKFNYDDQREFFRSCVFVFGTFDCFYRTKKIWGDFSTYAMCSLLTCTDMRHPEVWIGPTDGGHLRKEVLESIRAYINEQLALVGPSFEKADICDQEKHALLALFICESDLQTDFAERFQPFLDDIRRQIYQDLHRFYTEEMGLSEYSSRIGNLLTICHTFREGNVVFREFFRMQVTVFDLYVTESLFKDLVL